MLNRRPNEGDVDYHRRLVYGKLVDKTLSDVDYSELAQYVYGQEYSSDVARRMMYGSCRTLQMLDKEHQKSVTDEQVLGELNAKILELKKEQQRFYDQRAAYNKLVRERARQEELNDIIVRQINSGALPALNYVPHMVEPSDNDLLVSLNDIHFGAVVSNYWCEYNSEICRAMMRNYLDRILAIAKTHRSENCIVFANGDLISGAIHYQIAVSNKENLIEQIMGVSELIAEFLSALSYHFNEVRFVSVAGNHSRLDQKDKAIQQERLDDLVEWYLLARMGEHKNVIIGYGDKIDATMYVMDVRGKNYVGVHGDYDPSPSHIQALQTMVGKPVYAVLMGHKHHCSMNDVQGIKTVMAGSFLGVDDFCVSKRIYGQPEQLVCVCDETGIRCTYGVPLTKE